MVDNKDESLISHLEALRETLLKCLISLCIVIPFTLWLSPYALNFLVKVIAGSDKVSFNFFSPINPRRYSVNPTIFAETEIPHSLYCLFIKERSAGSYTTTCLYRSIKAAHFFAASCVSAVLPVRNHIKYPLSGSVSKQSYFTPALSSTAAAFLQEAGLL